MTGITREKASQVAASYLGGESLYLGTYYKTYAATDSQGRIVYLRRQHPGRKERKRRAGACGQALQNRDGQPHLHL